MKTNISSLVFDFECRSSRKNWNLARYSRGLQKAIRTKAMMRLIDSLVNVQRMRFITNRSRIDTHLEVDEWTGLINKCVRLDRVIIQLVTDDDFSKAAKNIEQELCRIRPAIIFRVKSVQFHLGSARLNWIHQS